MKIVHVITRLIVGGAQENTLLSCEGQHDAGHEVTLITGPALGPEGSLLERAMAYGYRVEVLDAMRRSILPVKDIGIYRALVRRFKELQPDVVHTHSSKAGIIGRYAAWAAGGATGRPLVVHTIHGLSWTSSTKPAVNAVYKQLEKLAAGRCHKIVVVADAMTKASLAAGIGRPEQYVTVYSGMETAPFLTPPVARQEMRRRLGFEDRHVAVCTISRLFHLKGHEDILAHAERLCVQNPDLLFVWVGDGLLRPDLESQISSLGLKDRFILTGLVPPERVPEIVNACDILAHPSRREGLARALPQGSLAGLPLVTYDIDGNAEALIEGETGYAVKPLDAETFTAHIATLARDRDLRRRMGEKGRAFALSHFDAKVMVQRLEEVYRDGMTTEPE